MQESYFEDQQVLSRMKESDSKAVLELYRLHREEFIHWAQHNYKIEEDNAIDIFQDTLVALHNNVIKGKLTALNTSLKTCLHAIGKSIIEKKISQTSTAPAGQKEELSTPLETEVIDQITVNDRQRVVASLLETIGEPCKTLLKLSYFKDLSIEAIVTAMAYQDENEAKKQKLRCVSTLKQMLKDRYNNAEF